MIFTFVREKVGLLLHSLNKFNLSHVQLFLRSQKKKKKVVDCRIVKQHMR